MNWKGIVIHCSDSEFGNASLINEWHKSRGWDGIGYHFVITNGILDSDKDYKKSFDGQVESGRQLSKSGAHARGYNSTHIGICLIGKKDFSLKQKNKLSNVIQDLQELYSIKSENIIGHYQCENTNKTCPNFDVDEFKEFYNI